ncbi:MAG: S1C family serine protease [Akkermansiaceae bacterium]
MKNLIISLIGMAALPVAAKPKVNSLGDLRAIEQKVVEVVAKGTPATVSLLSVRATSGSGVIVSADGLILTAAHVVEGNRELTVIFPDGREARAKVLGANFYRDAAMAQLIGEGPWPHVEIGDSEPLKTGDLVVAMGHPKGYDPTRRPPVRFGRVMTRETGISGDFFTTDCTVIGGDSGGPLFDLQGRVVGIHSHIDAKETRINNHAAIEGFKRSWGKMKRGDQWGRLGGSELGPERPVIGVLLEESDVGLKVLGVPQNSPAEAAGIRNGDFIVTLAGRKAVSIDALGDVLIDFERGDQVALELQRGKERVQSKVTLASRRELYRRKRR